MLLYKTIVQGRLEFGSDKTYNTVLTQFQNRAEGHYKHELVLKEEDIFVHEENAIVIPRYVGQASEKWFKNTMILIGYCAQFAVAGSLKAWMTNEGKILHYFPIEPNSEKIVVQSYLKGKSLVKQKGKQEEAIESLSKAIEKYDRHAQAYERRGKVNFILKNYHDAERDYNKSLNIDDTNAHAYFGRAKIHTINEKYEEAIQDFEKALKTSVALQPLYWKSRRRKGELHMKLKQWEKAAFDLKLFGNRKFKKDDPNLPWHKTVLINYGLVLLEQEEYLTAIQVFDRCLEAEKGNSKVSRGVLLRHLGIAKKKAGKKDFKKILKQAVEEGDKVAANILKQGK